MNKLLAYDSPTNEAYQYVPSIDTELLTLKSYDLRREPTKNILDFFEFFKEVSIFSMLNDLYMRQKFLIAACLFLVSLFLGSVNVFGNDFKVSDKGCEFIKELESCSLTRYEDNTGYSIGYGHRIVKGENYYKISKNVADKLFVKDINKMVNPALNRIIKELKFIPNQNLIDAIGSLIYNCGESGFKSTDVYKRLFRCRVKNGKVNKLDLNFTIAAIRDARIPAKSTGYYQGVKNRRMKEYKLAKGI